MYRVALVQVCKHFLREGRVCGIGRVLRVFTLYVDVHVSLFRKEEGEGVNEKLKYRYKQSKGREIKV